MKVIAIHQPQYLPYSGFFHKISHCDEFVLLDDAKYQVNGLINRNRIKGPNGVQWLTVPCHGRPDTVISDVLISQPGRWARKHWGTLQANYARAPYWSALEPSIKPLFSELQDATKLLQINIATVHWINEQLRINTPIVLSSEINARGNSTERLVRLCQARGATHYLSGPGGRDYMDLSMFAKAGIEVLWQKHNLPNYPQLFPNTGFIKRASILDCMFCIGAGASAELVGCTDA